MSITNVKNHPSSPYFDDYDESKGFQRILFRPGYSVQARELTQLQTMLQGQIDRFGQYAFKDGDAVIGGKLTEEFSLDYIKIEENFTYNSVPYTTSNYFDEFVGTIIRGTARNGNQVEAEVIDVVALDGNEPNTLYIKYTKKGGVNNIISRFAPGEIIESIANADGSAFGVTRYGRVGAGADIDEAGTPSTISYATGYGSKVVLEESVYFISGCYVYVEPQSLILDKYGPTPTYSVYLAINDEIVTAAEDSSLYDNATGSPNAAAPGANRYTIKCTLAKDNYNTDFSTDTTSNRILLAKFKNGIAKVDQTDSVQRNETTLTERLARRTHEESGNYCVQPFLLDVREHLDTGDGEGKYTSAQGGDRDKIYVGVEPSTAYVKGYRIDLTTIKDLEYTKPRAISDTFTVEEENLAALVGNYIRLKPDTVTDSPDISAFSTINLYSGTGGSGTNQGTARVREIEYVSDTVLGNHYRLYIFDVNITSGNFTTVKSVSGSGFAANLGTSTGLLSGTAQRFDAGLNSLLFKLPYTSLKTIKQVDSVGNVQSNVELSYDVRLRATSISIVGSTATVNVDSGVLANTTDVLVSVDGGTLQVATVGSGLGTGSFTVTGLTGTSASVVYTARRSGANVKLRSKTETNVSNHSITFSTGTLEYSLDKADIIRINSITDGSGNDYTSLFRLNNGQRNNIYGIGSIKLIGGESIANGTALTVDFDYYAHGPGDFFAVDSYYQASNYSVVSEAEKYEAIPNFSGLKGTFSLRDAIDFRPTATTGGGFSTTSMVRVNSLLQTDMTFYMPRIDKLYISRFGEIAIAQGVSSISPKPPKDPDDSMVIYTITNPGYVYDIQQVKLKQIDNKRYTMRDIGKLEKRIKNLEYYTSLSLIEKEASDTQIFDDNGNQRFKNGFIVDGFYGHNVANTTHPDHNCAMDRANGVLRPKFTETSVNLIRDPSDTGLVTKRRSLAMLPYQVSSYIKQPYASGSEFINPYNVFAWNGVLKLSPETDEWKEVDVLPDVVINDDSMYDQMVSSLEANGVLGTVWNEWETNWSGTEEEAVSVTENDVTTTDNGDSTTTTNVSNTTTTTTATTTSEQTRRGTTTTVTSSTNTMNLGNRVVETNFIPFIRSRKIYFKAELLKPNTRFYAFFDGVDVTDYCDQTSFAEWTDTNNGSYDFGGTTDPHPNAVLVTDASGKLEGEFIIPRNKTLKFRTGSRVFKLSDSINGETGPGFSFCTKTYFAQGILEKVEQVIVNVKVAEIRQTEQFQGRTIESTTSNTSTSSQTSSVTVPNPAPEQTEVTDPIVGTTTTTPQATQPPEPDPVVEPTPDPVIQPPPDPIVVEPPPEDPPPNQPPPPIDLDLFDLDLDFLNDLRLDLGPFNLGWIDPLAQTIMVDDPSGAYFSSIDLYFEQKDANIPVSVSLRICRDGYPTTTVIGGSDIILYPSDINVSADGSAVTKAVFDAPVYIPPATEIAIVLISNSDKPKVFVSTMGEFDVTNPSFRITKQPYNGVFFKSANASTWTAEQDRDLKFTINRCVFSTTPHSITFINEPIPPKSLKVDPFYFASNNGDNTCNIRVSHRDHNMYSAGDQVVISGAVDTNGILASNLNATHTISEAEHDSYMIVVTGQATATNVIGGGTNVRATHNVNYSVANIFARDFVLPGANIDYTLTTLSGKSIDNTDETAYNTNTLFNNVKVSPNRNITFTSLRCVPNASNSNLDGVTLTATFSNNGNNFISPVIDLERLSLIAINNRINSPSALTYDNASAGRFYVAETEPVKSSSISSYVTKRIVLENEAEALNAYLNVNRPTGSNVQLYYKVAQTGSNVSFDNDIGWTEITPETDIPIDNSGRYYEAAYSVIPPEGAFGSFAFKIVFTSTSSRKAPTCKDFRAIAST